MTATGTAGEATAAAVVGVDKAGTGTCVVILFTVAVVPDVEAVSATELN